MRVFIIMLCAVLVFSFSGCANTDLKTELQAQTATEQSAVLGEIMTAYLFEHSGENNICVAYPVVPSAEANVVNTVIHDFIRQETERLCSNDCNVTDAAEKPADILPEYSLYLLELDYRMASFSDEMISIIFEGLFSYKKAAYPLHVFFTLNIDPANGQRISFADRYVIDDALYDVFAAYARKDITEKAGGAWPENWGSFSETICDKDAFLDGLSSSNDFHVFYTDEGIGISYPVPHIMGDHLEVVLPYSEFVKINEPEDKPAR